MATPYTICVGTVGTGVWQSPDSGQTWKPVRTGLGSESRIYSLTVHPKAPHIVYAGADDGLYRSQDRGASFARLDSPMNALHVWKIALDPVDPDVIFAGTRPAALFRSPDGGRHWEQLAVEMAAECPDVRIPRVTSLVVDPLDHKVVWAGVEVDGVRRSLDGGETWSRIGGDLLNPDIHDIVIATPPSSRVLVSTPWEIFASTDRGETWHSLGVRQSFAMSYYRGLALKADDPRVIFVATGEVAASTGTIHAVGTGAIQRSRDGGQTWDTLPLPVEPNTPIWTFATHGADPELIVACSHYGELFISHDSGDAWTKLRKEFTEIRALAWTPN